MLKLVVENAIPNFKIAKWFKKLKAIKTIQLPHLICGNKKIVFVQLEKELIEHDHYKSLQWMYDVW